jgi:hypothetical protein
MTAIIILSTRSRLGYLRRIRDGQARGAFSDMGTPELRGRIRRLALLSLIGLVGTLISLIVVLIEAAERQLLFPGISISTFLLFGIVTVIGGFLMQREINRRL